MKVYICQHWSYRRLGSNAYINGYFHRFTQSLKHWPSPKLYCHKCIVLHGGTINGGVINLQLFTLNNSWTLTFKELYPQNNFLPFSGSFSMNVKKLQKMSLFDILGAQIDKQQNIYIKLLSKVSTINFKIAFMHRFKCRNNEIGFMTVIFVLHTKMYLWVVYWVISSCLNSSKNLHRTAVQNQRNKMVNQ